MTPPKLSPRSQAIAFRAWAWCEEHGWEHTLQEIADAIDVPMHSLRGIFACKGWQNRVRRVARDCETQAAGWVASNLPTKAEVLRGFL